MLREVFCPIRATVAGAAPRPVSRRSINELLAAGDPWSEMHSLAARFRQHGRVLLNAQQAVDLGDALRTVKTT
jgi:hypothetical protein